MFSLQAVRILWNLVFRKYTAEKFMEALTLSYVFVKSQDCGS